MSGMGKDGYEVLDRIGQGSFGIVSKVRRKVDHAVLCWKEINFGKMSEKEKSQLVSEVNIIRELRNPFIVRYHDRILHKPSTRLFIVMEYCACGDLAGLIKKARRDRTYVDEGFVWKILAQCVLALKECHRRTEGGVKKPVLHRDLKPANILLDSDKNVKIADFGLAKELSSKSQLAQTNLGTPYYMAPEIINEKDYGEKADIWSLGCLIYELAALRPPFEASNAVTLAVKINKGDFPRIPQKFSAELMSAISKMIQLDPRRRPRVEELEAASGIDSAMRTAKNLLSQYLSHMAMKNKERELAKREEQISAKEKELERREADLKSREDEARRVEITLQQQQQQQQRARRQSFGTMHGGRMDVDMEDDSDELPSHLRECVGEERSGMPAPAPAPASRARVPVVRTQLDAVASESSSAVTEKAPTSVPTVSIYIDEATTDAPPGGNNNTSEAPAPEVKNNYRDDLSYGIRRARLLLQGRGGVRTDATTAEPAPTTVFSGMVNGDPARKRDAPTDLKQHRYKHVQVGKENTQPSNTARQQKPAFRMGHIQALPPHAEDTSKEAVVSPWKKRRQQAYNPQPRPQSRQIGGNL